MCIRFIEVGWKRINKAIFSYICMNTERKMEQGSTESEDYQPASFCRWNKNHSTNWGEVHTDSWYENLTRGNTLKTYAWME